MNRNPKSKVVRAWACYWDDGRLASAQPGRTKKDFIASGWKDVRRVEIREVKP